MKQYVYYETLLKPEKRGVVMARSCGGLPGMNLVQNECKLTVLQLLSQP